MKSEVGRTTLARFMEGLRARCVCFHTPLIGGWPNKRCETTLCFPASLLLKGKGGWRLGRGGKGLGIFGWF